jgi:Protein prenyltransferase alpha subunit repeat
MSILDLFRGEAKICREIAERYPKNYYAWTHRRYFLGILIQSIDLNVEEKTRILRNEWEEMIEEWLPRHMSDHSAAHYAAQVLELWVRQLKSERTTSDLESVAAHAVEAVKALVVEDEDFHETLWILQRMVVTILLSELGDTTNDRIGLRPEVDLIAKQYFQNGSSVGTGTTNNVHMLTFLLWVAESLKKCSNAPIVAETVLHDIRVSLSSHPHIHHCMWAKENQEIE